MKTNSPILNNPAIDDPVIDEVREIRHRISERCGHDPARLVAYYMTLQNHYRDRLVPASKDADGSAA